MKLIDLAYYRKVNGLTQLEVAVFLGVSRAYISQVEVGSNNISDERIDKLLFDNSDIWPDTYVLVPAFNRLQLLCTQLRTKYEDVYYKRVDTTEYREVYLPLLGVLSEETILNIRHGRIPINEAIADVIIQVFPLVNQEWLTTGSGPMFTYDLPTAFAGLESAISKNGEILSELRHSLDSAKNDVLLHCDTDAVEERLDIIEERLSSIETSLGTISKVLTFGIDVIRQMKESISAANSKIDSLIKGEQKGEHNQSLF